MQGSAYCFPKRSSVGVGHTAQHRFRKVISLHARCMSDHVSVQALAAACGPHGCVARLEMVRCIKMAAMIQRVMTC